ncbi:TonB-dependent siderophore receptor [Alteromonas sp. 38]|uniref:TonB-dependent siderophore receptor n=1 Tax=unclassified Alteromonas TaxID=2614992 RepID=UPI0012F3EDD1|nr:MULTISPECIES: TonB-dependent siderophore receptor [unclassified Alteromonas]CAD5248189.1 TonB-dependent siderophore receptor [Alteromonas sp. 154]VXC51827.1 TonB-dependent siderophore receptor [Alteromonas sp. 38]
MIAPKRLATLIALACSSPLAFAQATDTQDKNEDSLEKITVVGTAQSRYVVGESSSLTGFELDFLSLPRVVNIIPEQLILDQKITDLSEALRNTPGVSLGDGFGGTNDDFLIRGFRRNAVYRDGFRRATNFKTNLSNVAYTQIIRGPASITYGQVEPGGLVDIVTKKPLNEQRLSGEARIGSFNDKFALVDWSQLIGDNAAIRLVGSMQDAESFRDFTDVDRNTLSISGNINLTPATQLNLSYEYRDEARPLDRGTITVPTPNGREVVNNLLDISHSTRFGESFEIFESNFNFFDATIAHNINDDWTLKVSTAYEQSSADDLQARPLAVGVFDADGPITDDGFVIFQNPADIAGILGASLVAEFDDPSDRVFLFRRTDGNQNADVDVAYVNAKVSGKMDIASVTHNIAIGANFRDFTREDNFVLTANTNGVPTSLGGDGPLFNVSNPIYGNLPTSLTPSDFPRRGTKLQEYGVFINDYVELTDSFSVLLGGRFDSVTQEVQSDGVTLLDLDSATAFSPQIAANYKLNNTTSLFLSYSEAFEPNINQANTEVSQTEPFDPEDSQQIEAGVKAEFFNGRLQTSVSVYDIDKTNVLADLDGVAVLRDGQTSQGAELSISGQPSEGMNVIAGYAYTDAEIEGSGSVAGNTPRNVAENTFNLWASYEFQHGDLEGLGIGGGYFYVGDRFGTDANSFVLDSYGLVDLSMWYTLAVPRAGKNSTVRFQLAVKNLLEEEYYSASGGDLRISIGAPRTVFGSVSFTL